MLYSDRHRAVLEIDGRHHYADGAGRSDPRLYAQMVSEDGYALPATRSTGSAARN